MDARIEFTVIPVEFLGGSSPATLAVGKFSSDDDHLSVSVASDTTYALAELPLTRVRWTRKELDFALADADPTSYRVGPNRVIPDRLINGMIRLQVIGRNRSATICLTEKQAIAVRNILRDYEQEAK